MTGNSILIGRVFGIPIRVHILLVILLPVLAMLYSDSFIFGLMLVVGVFTSVALHELGHSFVAMRKGCYVKEIVLSPIGGVAKMSNIPTKPMDEFQVAIAGPLVSLSLAAILLFAPFPLLFWIGAVNAGLFLFNLLPAFPMDGGRVLRAFLTRKKGRLEATRIAATI
ncbi:MAG: site-2 protease family protein, partial [Kiritimatiellales bacterium]|nr:site-2 protease family protein [Kiritimatiellales bacterium]